MFLAKNLAIDTNLANLLPSDYDSVQALEKLRETVGGESELAIGIQSPSFEDNVAFADVLIPAVLAMRGEGYDEPYFGRVEFRKDTRFLEDNALYFATEEELDKLQDFLDATIEDAALEANPLFFDLDDDGLGKNPIPILLVRNWTLFTKISSPLSTRYPMTVRPSSLGSIQAVHRQISNLSSRRMTTLMC